MRKSLIQVVVMLAFLYATLSSINYKTVNKDLDSNVNEVMTKIEKKCSKGEYRANGIVIIKKIKLPDISGLCMPNLFGYTIFIDSYDWEHYDSAGKYQLIAHEIFHCALGIGHIDNPRHFMYPSFMFISKEETQSQIDELLLTRCRGIK